MNGVQVIGSGSVECLDDCQTSFFRCVLPDLCVELLTYPQHLLEEILDGVNHVGISFLHANKRVSRQGICGSRCLVRVFSEVRCDWPLAVGVVGLGSIFTPVEILFVCFLASI